MIKYNNLIIACNNLYGYIFIILSFHCLYCFSSIGQFWKMPVDVESFSGTLKDPKFSDENRYTVSFSREDSGKTTSFTGLLQEQTWSKEPFPCLYAGDRQGGAIYEVIEPNDPVVEGSYKDYIVPSAFSEKDYVFGLFDDSKCPEKNN